MTLREAKQAVRGWIKQFSDEKLAQVYAFNQDDKMDFGNACSCILGVTLAPVLHEDCDDLIHYDRAICIIGSTEAENGYLRLGCSCDEMRYCCLEAARRRRLSAILRAEMRLRARTETGSTVEREVYV